MLKNTTEKVIKEAFLILAVLNSNTLYSNKFTYLFKSHKNLRVWKELYSISILREILSMKLSKNIGDFFTFHESVKGMNRSKIKCHWMTLIQGDILSAWRKYKILKAEPLLKGVFINNVTKIFHFFTRRTSASSCNYVKITTKVTSL